MTNIHDLLTEIRDAVVVPAPNHADLRRRATRIRRRRRLVRTAAGLGGVGVVAVAALAVSTSWEETPSERTAAAPTARPTGVPVMLGGRLTIVGDGGTVDTGVAGELLGVYRERAVVLAGGQLEGLEGTPITSVRTAFVDSAGATFQREDGTLGAVGDHLVFYTTHCESCHRAQSPDADVSTDGLLVGAGEKAVALESDSGLRVVDAAGAHPVRLASDGARVEVSSVQVAGDTVAVVSGSTVQFFDTDGTRRSGFVGGVVGALSADGTTYAYAPTTDELASGMKTGLSFYDTTTGQLRRTPLDGALESIAWRAGELLLVTERGTARTLWRCDTRGCESLFEVRGGSLSLR